MKGKFITFEGGEGSGKSTQIRKLDMWLSDKGYNVVMTREPGGTPDAELIRALLVQGDAKRWDAKTEALLMFASRRDHLIKTIWPALEEGSWVLSDRFVDSSRAYQGVGHGLGQEFINDLYEKVAGDFNPDLTIILDVDPEVGLSRAKNRLASVKEDRYESMGLAFHQKLRQAYFDIAKEHPERYVIISAEQDLEDVHKQIVSAVEERLGV